MKVEFQNIKGKELDPSILKQGYFSFSATRPIIVQPSEIMKVQTDLLVRVPKGYILTLSTAPELYVKVGELFPASLTIGEHSGDHSLELPVRNCGRDPLNIMPGNPIVVGFLLKTIKPGLSSFNSTVLAERNKPKSKPPKKNSDIKFEIR